MFLITNKYLMVRNSTEILFFMLEEDEDTEVRSWIKYFRIPSRGQIYYVRGTTRIQVITDDKIFFYGLDLETNEPFLKKGPLFFANRSPLGIEYKNSNFDVFGGNQTCEHSGGRAPL